MGAFGSIVHKLTGVGFASQIVCKPLSSFSAGIGAYGGTYKNQTHRHWRKVNCKRCLALEGLPLQEIIKQREQDSARPKIY